MYRKLVLVSLLSVFLLQGCIFISKFSSSPGITGLGLTTPVGNIGLLRVELP